VRKELTPLIYIYIYIYIYTTIKRARAADPNHPSHLFIYITGSDYA
jgi:hypothetical protein